MKKLELNEMENLKGGQEKKADDQMHKPPPEDASGLSQECIMAIGAMALGIAGIGLLSVGTAGLGSVLVASLSGLSGAIGMSACHGQL
ncbi:hypothetical protein LPB248_13515 [Flavobacterium sp. LPB0248]|uniref:hypothetical protein n=1 Tax=Flavobacterium sp. LPB0248 TaxID=2614441 RepID=UPI0015A6132A|nr:hypothetical protein [Flavobacterium sp. LPB0248]QLC67282.1 hypothetical protein LPB248_13515 [Flavobacterium sp. LPB0248]